MSRLYQIGWFSSGGSKTSRNLLTGLVDSIRRDEIKAEIAFVFCSREPGESAESDAFLKLVQDYGIPLVGFSYREFKAGQDRPAREIPLVLATIKIFSRGTFRVNSNKMVIDVEDYPVLAFDLTGEIEERLRDVDDTREVQEGRSPS